MLKYIVVALVTMVIGGMMLAVPLATATATPVDRTPSSSAAPVAKVTVPKLGCRRLDIAEDMLRSKGLRYREVGGGLFGIVVKSNWRVVRQRPAAGTRVARGTRVTLYVARSC
jgi:beta-lactam-binding protein with PASTA domain